MIATEVVDGAISRLRQCDYKQASREDLALILKRSDQIYTSCKCTKTAAALCITVETNRKTYERQKHAEHRSFGEDQNDDTSCIETVAAY